MDEKLKILVKNGKISLEDIDSDIDEIYTKAVEYVKNAGEYDKTVLSLMAWILQVRNAKLELSKLDDKTENSKKSMVIKLESDGILPEETGC